MNAIRSLIRELSSAAPVSCVATVTSIAQLSPSYTRVTVASAELASYEVTLPADGIKIGIPNRAGTLERRAMTVSARPTATSLSFDVLQHEGGIVAPWLAGLRGGKPVEVHAVRREFAIGEGIQSHLIVADASALPAAASLIRSIPAQHVIRAFLHAPSAEDARSLLPAHQGLELFLREANDAWPAEEICREVAALPKLPASQAWFAAEAASVAMLRRQWVADGNSRDNLFAAAYWKTGRDSTARDAGLMRVFTEAMAQQIDLSDPDVRSELELSVE